MLIFKKITRIPFKIIEIFEKLIFDTLFFVDKKIVKIENDQNQKFKKIGLDRANAKIKLKKLMLRFPIINQPMVLNSLNILSHNQNILIGIDRPMF